MLPPVLFIYMGPTDFLFFEEELIYNVVPISAVQQSDSAIHI